MPIHTTQHTLQDSHLLLSISLIIDHLKQVVGCNIRIDRQSMAVTVQITRRAVMRPLPALARGGGRTSPLTAFDRASTDGYIPAVYAWTAPAPSNTEIVDGLLATVARYPHLAGRLGVGDNGRRCFHLNDAGVLVMEAEADGDLADALSHDVSAHVSELYPKADKVRSRFILGTFV